MKSSTASAASSSSFLSSLSLDDWVEVSFKIVDEDTLVVKFDC